MKVAVVPVAVIVGLAFIALAALYSANPRRRWSAFFALQLLLLTAQALFEHGVETVDCAVEPSHRGCRHVEAS